MFMSDALYFTQPPSSLEDLWKNVLEIIRPKINPSNFEKWFLPLRCIDIKDNNVILEAPNRYIKEWVQDNFLNVILNSFETAGQKPYRIKISLSDKTNSDSYSPICNSSEEKNVFGENNSVSSNDNNPEMDSYKKIPPVPGSPNKPKINDKYTFDSFVVGPSNQLAEAASRAVSKYPSKKYNPLFIYGGVGLGKTHLLSAIGNQVFCENPSWNIQFITSERFMVEYINHIKSNKIERFRKKYRHDCDILLVDDIQFIAGKDRTQEEFFHTFNVLFENRRQIVLTSDQFPHEIPGLEDRLRNRFQWGLIADIQSPEFETRVEIIKKKAQDDNILLQDNVAHFLASNIKTNVRELEGALIRLSALSNLHKKEITIEFAEKTLRNVIDRSDFVLSADVIIKKVADHFDVKTEEIKGKKRHKSIAYPRQIAMYLTRELTSQSFPEIGSLFGGKDHTTVMSAVKKMKNLEKEDPNTRSIVSILRRKLQSS